MNKQTQCQIIQMVDSFFVRAIFLLLQNKTHGLKTYYIWNNSVFDDLRVRIKWLLFAERVMEEAEFPREKSHKSKTFKGLRFVAERRNPVEKSEVPARVMRRPNSRMILQRSQPRPALSGQLTVTMQGSLRSFPCWITTTSSHCIPMTVKWWV